MLYGVLCKDKGKRIMEKNAAGFQADGKSPRCPRCGYRPGDEVPVSELAMILGILSK